MSLRWPRTVHLRVEASRLLASVHRRGFGRTRALAQADRHWTEAEPGGFEALRLALDESLAELASAGMIRGACADVELADTWFVFDVIEGEFADHGERELQAVATACLAEMLGAAAAGYELRWQLQADERHLLICALPRTALAVLRESLLGQGLQLRSVQPLLCAQWQRAAPELGRGIGVLVAMQGASGSIACSRAGVIGTINHVWARDPAHIDAQVDHLIAGLGLDATTRRVRVGDDAVAPAPRSARPARPTPANGSVA